MVRADVSSSFLTCIKDVREKSVSLGSAGNRVPKEESLEQFSVWWQLRKLLCWSWIPSHIVFALLFNGYKGSIFSRPMMLSVNLSITAADFPFNKFAFYGVSVLPFTVYQFHTLSHVISSRPVLLSWFSWSAKFIL